MRTVLVSLLLFVTLALPAGAQPRIPRGAVLVITVDQAITGATTSYIRSALERAAATDATCLIIRLDTPGGMLSATHDIVKAILASSVPVVVYIAPAGARGASAGTIITMASHVAAMAPATHMGAAHPVSLFGGGGDKIMAEKIINDTSAYIESIAELRHRNAKWAISAVRESKSITADQAKKMGVIDLIADNVPELVQQLDGRTVRMSKDSTITLHTAGKPVVDLSMSFSQGLLSLLSNPNLIFVLLALAALGIYVEFAHPGLVLPGVAGGISLLLALIAMQMLPISYGSLGLILLGIALLIAETFVPSFGALGIGGLISIVLGSLFLLDQSRTDLQVARPLIFVTVGTLGLIALFIGRLLLRTLRMPQRSFQATMVGRMARVTAAIEPGQTGTVTVNGELWRATAAAPLAVGAQVVIEAQEGLELRVALLEAVTASPPKPPAGPAPA